MSAPSPTVRGALLSKRGRLRTMAMLGVHMMFHDRAKLAGTLLGVVFAVVLINQQIGVFLGLLNRNTMFVDEADADLWVVPPGTEFLQGGSPMDVSMVSVARGTRGIAWAEPLAFGAAVIKRPDGGGEAVTLVGTALPRMAGGPWNVAVGSPEAIAQPSTVIVEDSQRDKLGNVNLGSVRELSGHRVVIGGFSWGLLPFGPSYAFAEIDHARTLLRLSTRETSFVVAGVAPGVRPEDARDALQARLPSYKVMTTRELHDAIIGYLVRNQLGISFGTSTLFATIVGFVIVALSMFSAVVDNVREFGTLKAIGVTNLDLAKLLLVQSLVYALVGTTVGLFLVTRMAAGMRSPNLVLILPAEMYAFSYAFMVGLCITASTLALLRLRKLEPGIVFR